ncbi:DNA-binding domain-containing protein [Granulosicoccaceae sp. 1_MG-2023]|nr:DNA-binding domain-containing protein [Granulosicoccaceae sp. 1_MG-2023]
MHGLPEWQRHFAAAVYRDGDISGLGLRGALPATQLIHIHRNHYRASLRDALAAVFPATRALLGEACFAALCERFVCARPPCGPCLHEYGEGFAAWSGSCDELAGMAFVPDLAALEWAVHASYHAADAPCQSRDDFRAMAASGFSRAMLRPAVFLIRAAKGTLRLREWCLAGGQGEGVTPDVQDREHILVCRRRGVVQCELLSPAQAALLEALGDHGELEAAFACALACEPEFDLPAQFLAFVERGVFSRFS